MRVAIDTNLVVSATFKLDSVPAKLLAAWRMGRFDWISCESQLDEVADALFRPKVIARSTGGLPLAQHLVEAMRAECKLVELRQPLPAVCRDVKDDFLFALVDQGHVNMIVSGDKDVLALKDKYPVQTARELIDRL